MILCTYTSKLFGTLDLVRIDPYLHKFKHNFIHFFIKTSQRTKNKQITLMIVNSLRPATFIGYTSRSDKYLIKLIHITMLSHTIFVNLFRNEITITTSFHIPSHSSLTLILPDLTRHRKSQHMK